MPKKMLVEANAAQYRVELYEDGSVSLYQKEKQIGEGRLDTVVLREWGEAHLVDCEVKLGKTVDETQEIYDEIDDVLSSALLDPKIEGALQIPRDPGQLQALADLWLEAMSPEQKKKLLEEGAALLREEISRKEHLPPQQIDTLLALIEKEARE